MFRHTFAGVSACALVATALLTGSTPVAADEDSERVSQVAWSDSRRDVWQLYPPATVGGDIREVFLGAYPPADMTRLVYTHGPRNVRVRVKFVDLQRVGYQVILVGLETKFNHYQAGLFTEPGHRLGRRYFEGDDGSRSCQGFFRKMDYENDVVRIRLPRTCFAATDEHGGRMPLWVRVGLYHQLRHVDPEASTGEPTYMDKLALAPQRTRLFTSD
jgi:hypothetical protein